jgi:hypothetical protein
MPCLSQPGVVIELPRMCGRSAVILDEAVRDEVIAL